MQVTNGILSKMKYFIFALKVILILTVISAGYYFAYFKPHQIKIKAISEHYSNLVQNRTAYVNLAKLDSNSPDFDNQKANLIDIIKKTNAKGLESPLTDEEKRILTSQNAILEKVFATTSYLDGVAILKSDESVKLIREETELINNYK